MSSREWTFRFEFPRPYILGFGRAIGGGNAHERAALGARRRPSRDDRVPTCDHLIDAEVEIGERVYVHLHESSSSL